MTIDVFNGIDAIQLRNELFLLGTRTFDDCDHHELANLMLASKDAYYNSEQPILTDEQYDTVERYLAFSSPDDDVLKFIGSDVRGDAVPLPFPMGGLVQTYEGEVHKWITKSNLNEKYLFISDKLDGNSVQLVYDVNGNFTAGFTRGDGIEGADITRHLKHIKFPKKVGFGIRGVRAEIICNRHHFNEVLAIAKRTYKNPRNMVAGLMNASVSNPDVLAELSVVAYDIMNMTTIKDKTEQIHLLHQCGFECPNYRLWHGKDSTEDRLSHALVTAREDSLYEIDGLVIEAESKEYRQSLKPSTETLDPEYARKYKVADASNMAIAEVVAVHWGISKNGYLKPRVEIKPIDLLGVTVTYATAFHAWFIYSNHIGPGAKIKITRSGDVIPFITEVVSSMDIYDYDVWFIKQLNRIGEWQWTDTMVDAFLINDHPTIALERAEFFFVTLDVAGIREGNLVKLFDAGYNTPAKIIRMTEVELRQVLGENGSKIYAALIQKLSNVEKHILMAATGYLGRGVGRKKLKKLFEASNGDESIFTNFVWIISIEGFQAKTANRVVNGYKAYKDFVVELGVYLHFKEFSGAPSEGELAGQVYVFTGFRDKELQTRIEEMGGVVGDSFTSKTTCVIAKDPNEDSGKMNKARAKGISIISVQQFKENLE